MAWLLSLLDLPLSWVERELDSTMTRYLKSWSGLAKKGNPGLLYMSKDQFGLELPQISSRFQSLTSCKLRCLLTSKDSVAQQLAEAEVQYQLQLNQRKFVPSSLATNFSVKEIKKTVQELTETQHHETLKSKTLQGSLHRSIKFNDNHLIWASTLDMLPENIFKWSLNAVVDMVPHKTNLHRWNRSPTNLCPLCKGKQTLCHVLNNCPIALNQGRYTWRHNQVLSIIKDFIQEHLLDGYVIECDLPGNVYRFIRDNSASLLRPDIVIFNRSNKKMFMCELTIPFEEGIENAHERKTEKYEELVGSLQYDVSFEAIEVGSRGMLSWFSFSFIDCVSSTNKKRLTELLKVICRTAICCSYAIWAKRDSVEWY